MMEYRRRRGMASVEILLTNEGELARVSFHTMFTPQSCFEGSDVSQHYFLDPVGKCMCKKIDFEIVTALFDEIKERGFLC